MPKAVRNSMLEKCGGRARALVGVKDMGGNLTENAFDQAGLGHWVRIVAL
jgi:hypothetical protein